MKALGALAAVVTLGFATSDAALGALPGYGGEVSDGSGPGMSSTPAPPRLVPGEIIVNFKGTAVSRRVDALDASIARRLTGLPGVVTIKVDPGTDTVALAKQIAQRPDVEWAEPNTYQQTLATTNDPRLGELWGMSNSGQIVRGIAGVSDVDANVAEAWNFVTGGDTVVAIGDSGVALNHPDLAGNIWNNPGETGTDAQGRDKKSNGADDDGNSRIDDWRGFDFANNDNDPSDENGHGTHVAGTIGAIGNNAQGVSGVNQRVKIMPLKIGSNSRTDGSIKADAAAAAMLYAGAKGARVFNGSFGGTTLNKAQEDAIAANPTVLYVFAAGNATQDVDTTPNYPCAFNRPNIICVASINNQGRLSSFSNFGLKSVHLGAPGSAILSTAPFTFLVDDPFETPISGRYTVLPGFSPDPGWGISASLADDGTSSLTINQRKGFPPNTTTVLASEPVNLASCSEPVYEAVVSAQFSNGQVDLIVTDNQNVNDTNSWVIIDSGSNVTQFPVLLDLANVDSNGDQQPDKSYVGKTVRFLFGQRSGAGNTGFGATVDDFKISCKPNVFTGQEFQFLDGTSMASPMVAGVAGLVSSQFPAGDMNYIRSSILGSVAGMPSLQSKTITGGRLNALGALDTQPPNAFATTTPADKNRTGTTRPKFSWNASADNKTGIRGYTLVIDGKVAAITDGNGRSAQPTAPLTLGRHTWTVEAIDGAGLKTAATPRTITILDRTPPKMTLGKLVKRARASLALRGFQLECRIRERGTCLLQLQVSKADAARLGRKTKRKTLTLASKRVTVGRTGRATIKLKPNRTLAKQIRRARRRAVTFNLKVTGADRAGNKTSKTLKLRG